MPKTGILNTTCIVFLAMVVTVGLLCARQGEREWTDVTGNYTFEATLIAYNDSKVILQRGEELVSLAVSDLSDADRKFLAARKRDEKLLVSPRGLQTWTMANGLKVKGTIVDFAERDVTIQQHLGKTLVNDRDFDNLPAIYQEIVPRVVEHFEGRKFRDKDDLDQWLNLQPGREKNYHCEAVLFELEGGDRYAVPIFLFSNVEQAMLTPAFRRWAAAQRGPAREQESEYLRAQTQSAGSSDGSADIAQLRQIAEMQLQLQAYDAGLFDLWEVQLLPADGSYGMRQQVIVPARDSREATQTALQRFPGYRAGAIAKVRRKY
jgi:hypothetical protein